MPLASDDPHLVLLGNPHLPLECEFRRLRAASADAVVHRFGSTQAAVLSAREVSRATPALDVKQFERSEPAIAVVHKVPLSKWFSVRSEEACTDGARSASSASRASSRASSRPTSASTSGTRAPSAGALPLAGAVLAAPRASSSDARDPARPPRPPRARVLSEEERRVRERSEAEWFRTARTCNQRRCSDAHVEQLLALARKQRESGSQGESQTPGDSGRLGRRSASVPPEERKEGRGAETHRPCGVPGMPPGFGGARKGVPGMPPGWRASDAQRGSSSLTEEANVAPLSTRMEVKAGNNDLLERLRRKRNSTIE